MSRAHNLKKKLVFKGCFLVCIMPEKLDKCVKEIKKKVKKGELKKTYVDKETGKTKKTNPYAICRVRIKE